MTQFQFVKRLALWFVYLILMGGLIRVSNYFAVQGQETVAWIVNLLIISGVGRLLWQVMDLNDDIIVHPKPIKKKAGS